MKRLAFVFAVVVLALLSFTTPAHAQVVGGVLDMNWSPLQNVFVVISSQDPVTKQWIEVGGTVTDAGGRYSLQRYDETQFADGMYLVEIQAYGAQLKRSYVDVGYGYAYLEDVFIVQDMPGISLEQFMFSFDEGTYFFWRVTRNGKPLSSKYVSDTIIRGRAETKAWSEFSRRSSNGGYDYVFIPTGSVPEGSTFWGNVTVRSAKADLRVYSENNWFAFTPGEESPYRKKSADAPALVTEALQAARAKVASGK